MRSCLRGDSKYVVNDIFATLCICRCKQCEKITGSIFASNLFVYEKHLGWITGKQGATIYKDPNRGFTKAFCKICGSDLPFLTSDHRRYITPAGSLPDEPNQIEATNIFCQEISDWEARTTSSASKFKQFPE